MSKQKHLVSDLLNERKAEFVRNWKAAVEAALPPFLTADHAFSLEDFRRLFDAYLTDGLPAANGNGPSAVTELIKEKIDRGYPLSLIGILNAYFMATARDLVRGVYPDSFDARMEYLEDLSQRVLHNEIVISRYYENYVRDLHSRLRDQTGALERKHASLIEFIDCATQELQAPLWSILGFTAKLQRKYYSLLQEDGKHCLNRIATNVAEMHQLITDMTSMLLIEEETMKREPVGLGDLLDSCRERIRREVDRTFDLSHNAEKVFLSGDVNYLVVLFYQLAKNSAQYARPGAAGWASVRWEKDEAAGAFHLHFEDAGIGVGPAYRELVFKPLERLKEKPVEGSGLGLAFARRIVAGHKGSISLEDSSLGGVSVHIIFPLAMISIKE